MKSCNGLHGKLYISMMQRLHGVFLKVPRDKDDKCYSLLHDWLDYQLPRPRRAHDRLVTVKVLGSPGPLTP